MSDWMPIISAVLQAVLVAILPPIAYALVKMALAWAGQLWADARLMQPTAADLIEQAAEFAVQAAEQAGAAKLIEDKKSYALEIAEAWIRKNTNIDIDLNLVAAAIEKSVGELFPHNVETKTGYDMPQD
jgi:uncharacterized membrane protein YfbV (UPF0208 family)